MSTLTRWLTPVAASAAVVALFVGVTRATAPSSGGDGPTPDTELVLPIVTPSAEAEPDAGLGGRGSLQITGYRTNGHVLSVFFEVDVTDCYGEIARPQIEETGRHVRVTLRRASAQVRGQDCGDVSRDDVVDVRLSRPLAGRLVQDALRDDALVPLRMPTLNSL